MKLPLWMLAVPWVVFSSYTEHCDSLGSKRYQVRESTQCIFDYMVFQLPKGIADDMAYALNEAHEKRTKDHPCAGMTVEDCEFVFMGTRSWQDKNK